VGGVESEVRSMWLTLVERFKRLRDSFFGNWKIPLVAYVAALKAFLVLGLLGSSLSEAIGSVLLCVGLLLLVYSAIDQFRKKRWVPMSVTLLVMLGGTIVTFLLYALLSTFVTMVDGDHWADDLTIPDGIELHEPMETLPFTTDSAEAVSDLVLFKAAEPGTYYYSVRVKGLEPGSIYLKAYEITQEERLSAESLEARSMLELHSPVNEFTTFRLERSFKIYEGDWGKYYAARFEVWHRPSEGGIEKKLFEKNFKIEGWMH
jgi:hypothetical protein